MSTIAAGVHLIDAGLAESRIERELTLSRLARLRAADELHKAGRVDESRKLVDAVVAEQKAASP